MARNKGLEEGGRRLSVKKEPGEEKMEGENRDRKRRGIRWREGR